MLILYSQHFHIGAIHTMYEILTPNPYDRSEFAGTRSGTWEHVGDEEFGTIDAAREAIVELQQQGFGTLAIRRVGERYPEIGEIYEP